ncbi:MAG: DNA sulfur modification protein DndD [Candidatus Methanomethylophilaceae archaeon]|nr:DNA sulfur modification protein DndD [Candidatus Methanomethylophilaceae archaeon]
MKFHSLTIRNFRNYVGPTTIQLETYQDKNIILIGGMNGAGKTSMVDAIRLCLYGNRCRGAPMSEAKYQKYIQSICSKRTTDGMSVSMKITLDEENPPVELTIERNFRKAEINYIEELELKKGDSKVELIDPEYWSFYVEKLIPPTTSNYFFFDGEKVRDVIASDEAGEFLREAVDEISGISQLLNLKNDLGEVRKRILNKKTTSITKKLSELRDDEKRYLDELDEVQTQLSGFDDNLINYTKTAKELSKERARLIGSSEEKRKKLENKKAELTAKFEDASRIVSDFAYSRLPFLIASSSIHRTIKQAMLENSEIINRYSITSLKRIQNDPKLMKEAGLDKKTAKDTISSIINLLQAESKHADAFLDITLTRVEQLKSVLTESENFDPFIEAIQERENLFHDLKAVEKKLQSQNDSSMSEIDEEISKNNTEIEVLKRQIEIYLEKKGELESKLAGIRSEITHEERKIVLEDVDKESVKNIDLVVENIDNRISILRANSRQTLEKRINEIYHVLKNTEDMVKIITVPDSLDIELIDYSNEKIDIESISEGEKSILMYSVVYGLHSLSTSKFPVIIDSPLGRMDSTHVRNLVTKYYPIASSQVLLLSHDREVIGESYEIIKPYVTRSYVVRKFDKPKVIEGYFE